MALRRSSRSSTPDPGSTRQSANSQLPPFLSAPLTEKAPLTVLFSMSSFISYHCNFSGSSSTCPAAHCPIVPPFAAVRRSLPPPRTSPVRGAEHAVAAALLLLLRVRALGVTARCRIRQRNGEMQNSSGSSSDQSASILSSAQPRSTMITWARAACNTCTRHAPRRHTALSRG